MKEERFEKIVESPPIENSDARLCYILSMIGGFLFSYFPIFLNLEFPVIHTIIYIILFISSVFFMWLFDREVYWRKIK